MGVVTNIRSGLKLRNSYLLLEVIRKIDNWLIYFLDFFSLTTKEFLLYSTKDGWKFFVRAKTSDRGIMTAIYLSDEYKIKDLHLPDNSTVIDIGAHIGIFSICISKLAGMVYSYEAAPENFELLQKNIQINGLQEKIKAFNYAVSDKKEELKLFISKSNTGGHSIYGEKNSYILAPAIPLKTVIELNNISKCDLLKIDTEGSEYKILYGLSDDMFNKIGRIFLEYHNIDNKEYNHAALKEFLIKKGFKVGRDITYLFAERDN